MAQTWEEFREELLKDYEILKEYNRIAPMSDIGDQLILLRRKNNLVRSELSKLSGVSEKSIASIENGSYDGSISKLIKLAEVFGMKLSIEFVEDEND